MEKPVIHRAVQIFTNPASLARWQRDDPHQGQVRQSLCGSSGTGVGELNTTGYGLDNDVIRYADGNGRKLPAIPVSMVADVLALAHTLNGHAGVGAILALVLDHFRWPAITGDTRQYMLSCGCRRRKRSSTRRVTMLPRRRYNLQIPVRFPFSSKSKLQIAVRFPSRNQAGTRRGEVPYRVVHSLRRTSGNRL